MRNAKRKKSLPPEDILKRSAVGWEILEFAKKNNIKLRSKLEEGVIYVDAIIGGGVIWLATLEKYKLYINPWGVLAVKEGLEREKNERE